MIKAIRLTILLLLSAGSVLAQQTDSLRRADSLKADTIKIDTNLLNRYRMEPHRNALPIRLRPVQIIPQYVPVTLLDYKISYWHKNIAFGVNFNQSAFSNNWSAGGISSVALGTNFDYKLEYNKSPLDFTTETILIYGLAKNKDQIERKTNDRIFLDNKLATQLSKHWYLFGSLSFESQFANGYNYVDASGANLANPLIISKFMAPGYITESVGFEYKLKYFDLRLGTGTARQTFVLDTTLYHNQPANYGVKPGHTFLNELAFQVVAAFDKDIATNLHLNARYAGLIPYGRPLDNIDHRLDVILTAKVNKFLNVTVNGTALYDKDTSTKLQGTEGLALGILYKFP